MGLKVYGTPLSTNTARVIAALNEKGLDYEFVAVNLRAGDHKKPDFLAINPFGQVPVLEDGDLKLFESRAINQYLAKKETGPDLLRSGDPAESAMVDVWLEVESHQFAPPIEALVYESVIKPRIGMVSDPLVVEAHAEKLGKVLDVYEAQLSKSRYLAGGEFTLVDLNHLPYTYYLMTTPQWDLITSRPLVKAWWEDISSRSAWKKTASGIPI